MTTARERIERALKTVSYSWSAEHERDIRELLAELDAKCRWRHDDATLFFRTECGTIVFERGIYCPHCGKEIVSE